MSNFQVKADDECVPSNPQHQPHRVLGRERDRGSEMQKGKMALSSRREKQLGGVRPCQGALPSGRAFEGDPTALRFLLPPLSALSQIPLRSRGVFLLTSRGFGSGLTHMGLAERDSCLHHAFGHAEPGLAHGLPSLPAATQHAQANALFNE